MSLAAHTRLGPYEVTELLGAGGMGEVYKARDTRLDRTVAIKVLPAELGADPDRRARFEREARAVAALSHPHICALFDIGEAVASEPDSVAAGQRDARIPNPESRVPSPGRVPSPQPPAPIHFLVMEHLAGQTLAERLLKGPLPLAQALELGAQIADALDAAHKHGIIHRDLKPGNVMLSPGGTGRSGVTVAKLLDFGLAKLAAHGERPALAAGASAPTAPAPVTAEGTILGTLQYMAPEQLEGKEADARTDLWALGAILYEMVTGRRAFEGESQMSLAGNIMNAEPPALATLQPLTPPAFERLVTKCLAKHPDGRWDTAHDVADELRWLRDTCASATTPAALAAQPRRARWRTLAGASIFGVACAVAGAALLSLVQPHETLTPRPVHLSLDVRPADELAGGGWGAMSWRWDRSIGGSHTSLAWTPDGRSLVFVGRKGGVQQLYVRPLDADEAKPIPGTDGAQIPVVSTDGQSVVFWAIGALKRAPLREGLAIENVRDPGLRWGMTGDPFPPLGAALDDRGALILGGGPLGIGLVPADGNARWAIPVRQGEWNSTLPHPLPGSRAILYTARAGIVSTGEKVVAETLATGERRTLIEDAGDARYVPTGHLVFLRQEKLFAVPFDPERLELRGKEVPLVDGVARALTAIHPVTLTGAGQFAVSPAGALAWVAGGIVPFPPRAIVSVDRRGRVSPLKAPPRFYAPGLGLSRDGKRLAVTVVSHAEPGRSQTMISLWLLDPESGRLDPFVLDGDADLGRWTPDGQRVAFSWRSGGRRTVAWHRPDRGGAPEILVAEDAQDPGPSTDFGASSWSPDGRELAMIVGSDLAVATINGARASLRILARTPSREHSLEFSPDGKWLAFSSDESGRHEVYVRAYPGDGPVQRVSVDGGSCPAWGKGGRELYFVGPSNQDTGGRMMVADVTPGTPVRIGTPRPLFEFGPDLLFPSAPMRSHAVSPDGEHFYVVQRLPYPPLPPVTHVNVILNWFEELKAKVPAR